MAVSIRALSMIVVLMTAISPSVADHASAADRDGGDAKRLAVMTPEQFAATATVKDDTLETVALITTAQGFREKRGLLRPAPFDVFLRGFVGKRSGKVSYQVYMTISYFDTHYAYWTLVNYATRTGPVAEPLDLIGRRVGKCSRYAGCPRIEAVAFHVDEALLRERAAAYVPGALTTWSFKIKAKDGHEHLYELSAAEIGGLLMAVDAYRTRQGLPTR